ncbi:MAG: hypothetical protein IKI31_00330, partial [Treponema sp.]|nr:hypothetical protein [Treponema sp.]
MKKRFHSLYTIGPTLAIIVASLALVYSLYNAILLLRIPSSSKEKNYTNYPYHISLISDTQKNAVNENIFLTCKNLQKQYNCAVNIIFPSEQSTVQN